MPWSVLETFIAWYFNLSVWRKTWKVDLWVLLRLAIVVLLLSVGTRWIGAWSAGVAALFLLEVVLYQAGVVIRGDIPDSGLRLLFLTITSYVTVGLCFAVFYATLGADFNQKVAGFDGAYFSFVTLGTIGFGDIIPRPSSHLLKAVVVAEHLVGLYYLAVVLVVAVDLAKRRRDAA